MATPSFGVKSRRKPATYGKASRRDNTAHKGLASNKLSLAQNEANDRCERTISGRIRKDGATSPPELCRGSPESSVDHNEPLPVICNRSQSRSITPAIVTTESFEGYQNNVIYDVPSSDEHSAVSFPLRVRNSSKRRKLSPVSMEEYSSVVWDDQSLQKHIATETASVMRKRMKSSEPQGLSTASIEKPKPSTTRKPTYRSTRPPGGTYKPAPSTISINSTMGGFAKPDVVHAKQASSTKSRHGMNSVPQATLTHSEDLRVGLNCNHFEHTVPSANTLKNAAKCVLLKSPDLGSSLSAVTDENSLGGSFPSNLVSAQELGIDEPMVCIGKQSLSPGRLEISSLDISSSEGASHIPYAYNKINHQARGPTLSSSLPSPSRVKIKDRLRTPSKPSAPLQKTGIETGSDSDSDSPLRSPSSGRSQTGPKTSREAVVYSAFSERNEPQPLSSTGASNRQNGAMKVTYGRERSFLTEEYLDKALSTYTPASDVMNFRAATKAATSMTDPCNDLLMPQELPVLPATIDESTGSNTGAIRSIHELRQAGGNARMTGDIEAILDDIDEKNNVSLSLRRSGLLEVTTKLQQPEFRRRFVDLGLEARLLAHVDSCNDTIAGNLLLTAILQIIAHPVSSHTIAEFAAPAVLKFLGRYLECHEDLGLIVRSRKFNMPKALRAEVAAFCASFMLADVWTSGQPTQITGLILSLQCLEYIVRQQREAGSTSDILSHETFERLTEILIPNHNAVVLTLESGATAEVELSLSILESSSIAKCSDGQDMLWTSRSIAKIAEFLSIIQMQVGPPTGTLRTLALRLCLNLTNNNSTICHAFSTPTVIHATLSMIGSSFSTLSSGTAAESTEIVVDNLVLSLGLLINLAEWNERTRKLFLSSDDDKLHPLSALSEIFESNIDRISEVTSEKEIRLNVPFGYLSILLSFLSISVSIRQRIRPRLRGQMLSKIFGAVEEFLQYHRQITDEIREAEEGDDLKANFVSRVQSVIDRLKREEQAHQGEAPRM
ncbi:hypothetical protein MMC26_004828 [Xylographa opegraphella]|nr:hypothetical protein [Xylographa opegraphella]